MKDKDHESFFRMRFLNKNRVLSLRFWNTSERRIHIKHIHFIGCWCLDLFLSLDGFICCLDDEIDKLIVQTATAISNGNAPELVRSTKLSQREPD